MIESKADVYRGHRFPPEKVKAATERSALKSTATPDDVADHVKTIVLSKSITGQNIVIDCGIAI
jgi:enoyl-[acyl-carrier-protein] reductase (NADH)